MANPSEITTGVADNDRVVTVLLVTGRDEHYKSLSAIFGHSNWRLYRVRRCSEAREILRTQSIATVLCESQVDDGDWKALLDGLATMDNPPLLIVTALHADDHLWGEVLNLGGYDVLPQPFDRNEVVRVLGIAWLNWRQKRLASQALRKGAAGSVPLGNSAVAAGAAA